MSKETVSTIFKKLKQLLRQERPDSGSGHSSSVLAFPIVQTNLLTAWALGIDALALFNAKRRTTHTEILQVENSIKGLISEGSPCWDEGFL